ncbi:MAG: hypothetical protein CBE33_01220 [Candidatus Pelagibacter sp. TMED273]|nr:MAG: hypothetical protein CBE33_01220 [Candidatus Pelagibacter sp. TMED273]|tara:strand:- start:7889 stop:8623 length:735 start_codon:yes stop_codon:yes gene_type:complete
MIYFISFATDENYKKLSDDVLGGLNKIYPNSELRVFSKEDLTPEIIEYCEKYKHGYGYFIWKPFLISNIVNDIPEGDIVFYIDGRTGLTNKNIFKIRNKLFKISWINKFLNSEKFDLVAWKMSHNIEETWTTGDLLSLLNVMDNKEITNSGQFSATFFGIRVSDKTKTFVKDWYDIMSNNLDFSRDEPSLSNNSKSFIQNRYDQSFLSILIKQNFLNLNILELTNDEIFNKQTLIPHMKKHPTK